MTLRLSKVGSWVLARVPKGKHQIGRRIREDCKSYASSVSKTCLNYTETLIWKTHAFLPMAKTDGHSDRHSLNRHRYHHINNSTKTNAIYGNTTCQNHRIDSLSNTKIIFNIEVIVIVSDHVYLCHIRIGNTIHSWVHTRKTLNVVRINPQLPCISMNWSWSTMLATSYTFFKWISNQHQRVIVLGM